MMKNRSNLMVTLVIVGLFLTLTSVINLLANESEVKAVKYIEVFQKDGKIDKFEYEAFDMSWILPITLREHVTREDVEIKKDNFEVIHIVGRFSSGWDEGKEDLGVMVHLVDTRKMLGFFHVSEHIVKGILSLTGEEKSIPFKDVKKIVFKR